LNPVEVKQLDGEVSDWCEMLYGHIPENQLLPAFDVAIHSAPGAGKQVRVRAFELLDAYRIIAARSNAGPLLLNVRPCSYCKMFESDPTEFPPCPFHTK